MVTEERTQNSALNKRDREIKKEREGERERDDGAFAASTAQPKAQGQLGFG